MKIINIPSGPLMVNSYIAWDEKSGDGFIVDPGGFNPRMEETINKEKINLKYVILTHGHGDHIGGVNIISEKYNAKIVAAEAEAPMLKDPRANMSADFGTPVSIVADISVKDGDTLDVGNMRLEFIMTPGHSPGGMCIRIGTVLFSGDTLFQASVGRTDFAGGSMPLLIKSIKEKLFVLPDDTRVFPGHMGATTIGFEKENNPFV